MDICLIQTAKWTQIRPTSIHGMLWLQTHFENSDWEALASESVKIPVSNANMLANDATKAGLSINSVPCLVTSKKF